MKKVVNVHTSGQIIWGVVPGLLSLSDIEMIITLASLTVK